ncbi:hypothetical protein NDU88_004900 [Pleurodeles waltl]|uniref:Uncharacterized protein n=1 Tax=Pleurodeles waltl TaxID=8319 RepID=A0AAV7RJG0_PLEWA|nr:hypothetical protein NDU88_004900 [Pleurodeles waltl]
MVEVRIGSAKVMFFLDYTMAVQKQRNNVLVVKRHLREMGYTYSLLFPAKVCVVTADTTHFFVTSVEAWLWLESSDGDAESLLRSELQRGGATQRHCRGQRRCDAALNLSVSFATRGRAATPSIRAPSLPWPAFLYFFDGAFQEAHFMLPVAPPS